MFDGGKRFASKKMCTVAVSVARRSLSLREDRYIAAEREVSSSRSNVYQLSEPFERRKLMIKCPILRQVQKLTRSSVTTDQRSSKKVPVHGITDSGERCSSHPAARSSWWFGSADLRRETPQRPHRLAGLTCASRWIGSVAFFENSRTCRREFFEKSRPDIPNHMFESTVPACVSHVSCFVYVRECRHLLCSNT